MYTVVVALIYAYINVEADIISMNSMWLDIKHNCRL